MLVPLKQGNSLLHTFWWKSLRGFSVWAFLYFSSFLCRCFFFTCIPVYLFSWLGKWLKPKYCFSLSCSSAHFAVHNQLHSNGIVLHWPNHNLPQVPKLFPQVILQQLWLAGKESYSIQAQGNMWYCSWTYRKYRSREAGGSLLWEQEYLNHVARPGYQLFRLYKHTSSYVQTCSVIVDSIF